MSKRPFSILDRWIACAGLHSRRLALASGTDESCTYGELLDQVARLGARLGARGAGGKIVALDLPRSPNFVRSLLACWWAGAAFLPLARSWPQARREEACHEAGARLVLTDGTKPRMDGVEPLDVEERDDADTRSNPRSIEPGDLAYVICTSGSTGRPKAVAIEHRGLVSLLDQQIVAFDLRPGDRVLWVLDPAFDASLSDIGTTLLAGATLHLAGDPLADAGRLLGILHERRITHLDLPPALLRVLDPESMPDSLRTFVVGGEASPPEVLCRWARRFRVVNVYGPTEATICTSLCVCDPDRWTEPLLGQPLAGVLYHLLGDELAIEGDCLARGYLGQPELTARKFILHDGSRLYRTGDHVRRRPDGEYVFLGRIDRQVKLHGRLIEPEEIESRLRECPGVGDVRVVLRGSGGTGTASLVAFVEGNDASPTGMRAHLDDTLPTWMVPARYVVLPRLPRGPSGKIDMDALQNLPIPLSRRDGQDCPLPRLARLLKEVLEVESLDWNASFSAHGGDSLAILRCVAGAAGMGLAIPPTLLANHRSLADVAAWLEQGQDVPPGAMPCATLRNDVETLIPACSSTVPSIEDAEPVGSLLLTGATGFLGGRLLECLLERTSGGIVCLVRARTQEEAWRRLGHSPRVRILRGDLAQPGLGLDETTWLALSREVETICHVGASVHLVAPYEALRGDNVLGTLEVVRLARAGRGKTLHHISTLSVFVATDRNRGLCLETDDLGQTAWVHGGYAQSKWAAEWLVRNGAEGQDVRIYRLGLITGDSRTGVSARRDLLNLFLRGIVQLGCLPPLDPRAMWLDVTPVDHAAQSLAHLVLAGPRRSGMTTYHLAGAGRLCLQDLVEGLARRGIDLPVVASPTWQARLAGLAAQAPEAAAACLALCRGLPLEEGFDRLRTMDLFQATDVSFDMTHTREALAGSGIVCPLPTPDLVDRYLEQALSPP